MGMPLDGKQHELLRMHVRMAQQLIEELYSADEVRLAHAHLQSAMRILSMLGMGEREEVSVCTRLDSAPVKEKTPSGKPAELAAVVPCEEEVEHKPMVVVKPVTKQEEKATVELEEHPATPGNGVKVAVAGVKPVDVASPVVNGGGATKNDRLADTFSQRGVRNEVYAHGDNLAEARRKSLPSIASALSLNDRRYYANELCGGDRSVFGALVSQLDASPSLAHSIDLLQHQYQGSADNPALQEFIALLDRRFS